jgi:hypothetical protein
MNIILFAGYPKTGNTLIGQALTHAGGIFGAPYDICKIRSEGLTPCSNPLFEPDICCIKTHDSYRPFGDLNDLYFGNVLKVVIVNRNPFDMLLSCLNYFRLEYIWSGNKVQPLYLQSLKNLMPDFKVKKTFLFDFTLDKLRDNGMLDVALKSFGENGTSILNFYRMSGTWSDFSSSYDHSGVSLFKISYEELESISTESSNDSEILSIELSSLSSFLEVDAARLKKGFAKQRNHLSSNKSEPVNSVKFFNKACSGYWRNYFSAKVCKDFVNLHYSAIIRNGYESLVDEVA